MTYYSSSSYGTKYTKTITNERGVSVTLNIKMRGYSGRTYQIGELQSILFQIQGNDEVTAPIVKTNLQVTVVDDMFSPGVDSNGMKYDGSVYYRCGNWKELYTPDSTLYLVEVYYGSTTALWRGYITPDSYSESLDAYGSVTFTARDNIGHLQDFDFDLSGDTSGLVNILDFIEQAFTKIAYPMDLSTFPIEEDSDHPYLVSEDGNYQLKDLCFNAAALEGMTYYDALEEVLNSLGLCLRYCGYAQSFIAPLRAMPYCGYDERVASSEQPSHEVEFYGRRSGTRTFDPAYRQIVENVNFEQEDDFTPDIMFIKNGTASAVTKKFTPYFYNPNATDPSGDKYTVAKVPLNGTISSTVHTMSGTSSKNGWTRFPTNNLLLDTGYTLRDQAIELEGEGARDYVFLAANLASCNAAIPTLDDIVWIAADHVFARIVKNTQMTMTFHFAAHPMGFGNASAANYDKLGIFSSYNLARVECYISYSNGGVTRYWDGSYWRSDMVQCVKEYDAVTMTTSDVEFDLLSCDDVGDYGSLVITISRIRYQCVGYSFSSKPYVLSWPQATGVYARLKSITFSSTSARKMKSDTVTTICNTANNVRCERNPALGFLPTTVDFVDPINYKNAFYVYDSSFNIQLAPYRWRWNTDQSVLPFPVKIHQQLLMYHYTTEEILEGDCGKAVSSGVSHGSPIRFDSIAIYKGVNHIIKSCTLDLVKNRLTSAQLRSYKFYTDLWDGTETHNDDNKLT